MCTASGVVIAGAASTPMQWTARTTIGTKRARRVSIPKLLQNLGRASSQVIMLSGQNLVAVQRQSLNTIYPGRATADSEQHAAGDIFCHSANYKWDSQARVQFPPLD